MNANKLLSKLRKNECGVLDGIVEVINDTLTVSRDKVIADLCNRSNQELKDLYNGNRTYDKVYIADDEEDINDALFDWQPSEIIDVAQELCNWGEFFVPVGCCCHSVSKISRRELIEMIVNDKYLYNEYIEQNMGVSSITNDDIIKFLFSRSDNDE